MRGLVIKNVHVKYESPIYTGSEVMAKFKVFVHTDADAGAWRYGTPPNIRPAKLKVLLTSFIPKHLVLRGWSFCEYKMP